jgi:hypothetical protein
MAIMALYLILTNIYMLPSVSEWLLFIAKWAICQLYQVENKRFFLWDDYDICFALDRQTEFDFYNVSLLKQQSTDIRFHSDTLSWLVLLLNATYLAEKQQMPMIYSIQGDHIILFTTDEVITFITIQSSSWWSFI